MCAAKEQAPSVADRACCDAVILSQKVEEFTVRTIEANCHRLRLRLRRPRPHNCCCLTGASRASYSQSTAQLASWRNCWLSTCRVWRVHWRVRIRWQKRLRAIRQSNLGASGHRRDNLWSYDDDKLGIVFGSRHALEELAKNWNVA